MLETYESVEGYMKRGVDKLTRYKWDTKTAGLVAISDKESVDATLVIASVMNVSNE